MFVVAIRAVNMFVFVFVPLAVVQWLFRSTPLGRPRGFAGDGWIPSSVMAPATVPPADDRVDRLAKTVEALAAVVAAQNKPNTR